MEPENLLPNSQDATIGPYPEWDETNPHPPIFYLGVQFIYPAVHIIDLPSDLLLVSNIPAIILFTLSSPPVCHIPCPSHSPKFDDFNNIWWGVEVMKLLISNFLDPPHYLLPFKPTNLAHCPVSNTLSLWYSPNVRQQAWNPYKTTGNTVVLYILIFMFWIFRQEDKRFFNQMAASVTWI